MKGNVESICKSVELMDEYLRGKLRKTQLWENTFICKQIDKRSKDDTFTINDHIRAMVYSMLSSGAPWERLEKDIDPTTGKIPPIDEIFCEYEPFAVSTLSSDRIYKPLKDLHYATPYTLKQIEALKYNIMKFHRLEKRYGSVENCYQKFSDIDSSLKTLVLVLSAPDSSFKLEQMGAPLTAEYLRNVGYDIAKPDRHIRRILSSKILGYSLGENIPIYAEFEIVANIAGEMNKSTAEVDYILWAYCASGFGEVCTKDNPKCGLCVVKSYCKNNKNSEVNNG